MKTVRKTIHLPESLLRKVASVLKRRETDFSKLTREALKAYLDTHGRR